MALKTSQDLPFPSCLFATHNILPGLFAMASMHLSARDSPAEFVHGWMFIGATFNGLLLGVMTIQVYDYFSTYSKRDNSWVQMLVASLYSALALSIIFIVVYLHRVLITFFGDVETLTTRYWVLTSEPVIVGIIVLMVQLFFTWRVYALTKSMIAVGVVGALALVTGGAGMMTAYEIGRRRSFIEFKDIRPIIIVGLSSAVACDMAITACLVVHLNRHKTGFPRSDLMVNRIIRVTMQTGLLTMIVATGELILFLVDPQAKHLVLGGALGGLYATSLMTSLNSRKGWKYDPSENPDSNVGFASMSVNQRDDRGTGTKSTRIVDMRTPHPEVFIHVESHQLREVGSPGAGNPKNDKVRDFGMESDIELCPYDNVAL